MTATPSVTVLMTVYNGLPYLRDAIESVLSQSYGDLEFLIIDDASTDGSVACIQSFADPRIRLLHNGRNLGQTRSLNLGLPEARGRYVARLDQDDVCLPNRFSKQVAYLEQRPSVAVVGAWSYRINSLGRKTGHWCQRIDNYGAYLAQLLLRRCPLRHPSVMFRRQVVVGMGGYDEAYEPAEDYDLWIRLATQGYRAALVPETLILNRVHDTQLSTIRNEKQRRNTRRAHQKFIDAFCREPEAKRLGNLLRMEGEFWSECRSKEEVCAVLDALDLALADMEEKLSLDFEEAATLRQVVYQWIGPGAMFRKKLASLPSPLFYPVFMALCPLLIPNVRQLGTRMVNRIRRLRWSLTGS